jgi:hypothetical protein
MVIREDYVTPAVSLICLLSKGAQITKASTTISNMLNGIKYYSAEVTLNEICYCIQAHENEAIELHHVAMLVKYDKKLINTPKAKNQFG